MQIFCPMIKLMGTVSPQCKSHTNPLPFRLFCDISLLDSLIWNTFFLTTHSNFSVLQIRGANTLSFGVNILLPYFSYCFPYFLPYENCFFLLSLKTQQWCMLLQPHPQCFFLNAEWLIGEESRSIATHFAFSCAHQTARFCG